MLSIMLDLAIFVWGAFGGPIPSHVYSVAILRRSKMSWASCGDINDLFCVSDGRGLILLIKRASGPTPKELSSPRRICVTSGTHRAWRVAYGCDY